MPLEKFIWFVVSLSSSPSAPVLLQKIITTFRFYIFFSAFISWPQKPEKVLNWNQSSWLPIDYFTHWRTKEKWRKRERCVLNMPKNWAWHTPLPIWIAMCEWNAIIPNGHTSERERASNGMKGIFKTKVETEKSGYSSSNLTRERGRAKRQERSPWWIYRSVVISSGRDWLKIDQ